MLREMVYKGSDVSKICTTHVTDMSDLFKNKYSGAFNQDISYWDLQNVSDTSNMFYGQEKLLNL